MSIAEALRANHADAWERVVRHPFVLALGDGTLPREAFAAYMVQDYLFVDALMRTVAHGIAKSPDAIAAKGLNGFLQTLLGAEDDLFGEALTTLFTTLRLSWPIPMGPESIPVTRRFCGYLSRIGERGSFASIATALFVTEGTYADWATRLVQEGRLPEDTLYRDWIRIHADTSLSDFVRFLERHKEQT